jgi:hypothetical protein
MPIATAEIGIATTLVRFTALTASARTLVTAF